jgi:hypothetical protein
MASFNCHKGRAETVDAARILIARGLVNLALGAEIGFKRMDR